MLKEIQKKILEIIRRKCKKYPVTINDLVEEMRVSYGVIDRHVKILVREELIQGKRVVRPKGGVTYYKTPGTVWPKHLGRKCSECKNKGKTLRCIYYEELAEEGIIAENRTEVTLTKNTYACDKFIEKEGRKHKKKYEEFLDENRRIAISKEGLKISYHCANEECQAELPILGNELIAKLGSSVIRCDVCNSFYTTLYDEKKGVFMVHYNTAKEQEYIENFTQATGGKEPEPLYSSDSYGIVINNLRDCNFNFRTKTLANNNWVGKINNLSYLVAKRKEDYDYLVTMLEGKGYNDIQIILGADKLISPQPIKQQVWLLRLLRETMIANKEFCTAMLTSRITVIEKINEQFKKEKDSIARKATKKIEEIIKELERKSWLTVSDWNNFEMRAGKAMWTVISTYLKTLGIPFPGRGRCRLVEDVSKPHRLFYAYSKIDTLINGVFGLAGEFVKEYLMEIKFCWDGLPGLCHKKTSGGVLGFYLDMREQEKILTLPYLLEALTNEEIEIEKILYLRGRNREKIYYVREGTELEEQLREVVEEMKRGEINGKGTKNAIRNYYWEGKQWLGNLQRGSNNINCKHHGVEYQPWAIMKEEVWVQLGRKERLELINALKEEHRKIKFKPLTIQEIN